MRKYRFFYHYRKLDGKMSVHFRKQCLPCEDVVCRVECETKRNTIQPFLVMQGFCTTVRRDGDKVVIE